MADEVLTRALADLHGDEPDASFVHAARGAVAREAERGHAESTVQVVEIARKKEERTMNGHRWSIAAGTVAAATVLGLGVASITHDREETGVVTEVVETVPETTRPKPQPTPPDVLQDQDLLTPGTYRIPLARWFGARTEDWGVSLDVPAGWAAREDFAVVDPLSVHPDTDTAVGALVVGETYADPCNWLFNFRDPPIGPSARALVDALAADRSAVGPAQVTTFDGYVAWKLTLVGPEGTEECDGGEYSLFHTRNDRTRFALPPGHTLEAIVVDADGRRVVLTKYYGPDAPQDRIDQMADIVASMRIDR